MKFKCFITITLKPTKYITAMKNQIKLFFLPVMFACLVTSQCFAQAHSSHDVKNDHSITILAEDYAFQAPDRISSGWTTINYENQGTEPHFMLIAKVPDGHTFDEYATDVLLPFNDVWYSLRDDGISVEKAFENLGATVPEWFWSVEFMGGIGVLSPGHTSEVTLNLDPGTYVLECYIKTEDGEMHSMEGMLRELTVTEEPSGATAPEADIQITLSNFEMDVQGYLSSGPRTVSVHLKENPEEGFGHNVHVARLEPDTNVKELIQWMNFFDVEGLRNPNPSTFLGGMHLLPVGETGYFTIDLKPGRYLFVSEYTGHLGVLKEVTVE